MIDDVGTAYRMVATICAIGLAIDTAEYLTLRQEFRIGGMYSWRVLQFSLPGPLRSGVAGKVTRWLYLPELAVAVLVLRFLACLGLLLIGPGHAQSLIPLVILASSSLYLSVRTQYGGDGADQMSTIVVVILFLTHHVSDAGIVQMAGLWFIALQGCLSYFAAGAAKLISPTWRSGKAVSLIFRTGTYSHLWVAHAMASNVWISFVLSWGVILYEVLFPLAFIAPTSILAGILVVGVLFHALNAVVMGLNSFFWAFTSTYPAIIFVSKGNL